MNSGSAFFCTVCPSTHPHLMPAVTRAAPLAHPTGSAAILEHGKSGDRERPQLTATKRKQIPKAAPLLLRPFPSSPLNDPEQAGLSTR